MLNKLDRIKLWWQEFLGIPLPSISYLYALEERHAQPKHLVYALRAARSWLDRHPGKSPEETAKVLLSELRKRLRELRGLEASNKDSQHEGV